MLKQNISMAMIVWSDKGCYAGKGGSGKEEGERKEVKLVFVRNELLYDMRNRAWARAHTLEGGSVEGRHMLADIGEEGNVDVADRILGLAHALVVEALMPLTRRAIGRVVRDDVAERVTAYEVRLEVGEDFGESRVELLRHVIHEYMVCTALWRWSVLVLPEAAEYWRLQAQEQGARIEGLCMADTGCFNRPLKPF